MTIDYDALTRACLAVFVFSGFIAFLEPSPYEILFFVTLGVWLLGGVAVSKTVLPFLAVLFAYELGGFVSLIPHLHEPDPTVFMLLSLYLAATAVFFALFFAQDTERRVEVCLKAYAWSTVPAALCGIVGYLDLGGTGDLLTLYGRASGTFKDPNVYGSYLVLGAVYFVQRLLLMRTQRIGSTILCLGVVVTGIFLSFSRGSWGSTIVASLMSIGMAYATSSDPAMRRRIVRMGLAALVLVVVAVAVLLAFSTIRELFLDRFSLAQDYDVGETGRFGNQMRSIPLLLDAINGFGPLRFRLIFDIEPHNTFLNAFASYGWLGGFAYLLLVGLTSVVGFRVALAPSPYRRMAQVAWPALMVLFLQGFQIDIDHWRQVFLLLGLVWGLETARRRWRVANRPALLAGEAVPVRRRSSDRLGSQVGIGHRPQPSTP